MNAREKNDDLLFHIMPGVGLMLGEVKLSNCAPIIVGIYASKPDALPELVVLDLYIGSLPPVRAEVSPAELNYRSLNKRFPIIHAPNSHCRSLFNEYLADAFQACLERRKPTKIDDEFDLVPVGRLFKTPGLHRLDDGTLCAVEGEDVIGCPVRNFYIAPETARFRIQGGIENPLGTLFRILRNQPSAVFLTVAFSLLSLVRSVVIDSGIDLQAVLYISGPQGTGKTTLAQRAAGFIVDAQDSRGTPALFYGAGGTWAAIRDAMAAHRDLPMIVDDLCMSASKQTMRQRQHLAAQTVREAANAAKIVKKSRNGAQIEIECQSGVILTAEFALDNASDLTRCVIARVKEPLGLPDEFSTELMGSVAQQYVRYFVEHSDSALQRLRDSLKKTDVDALEDCEEARVRTNLITLRWAFDSLFHAAAEQGADLTDQYSLYTKFDDALRDAVDAGNEELQRVRSNTPDGNLAYILLRAVETKAFRLIKKREKLEKLPKKDGIWFEGDLCLRSAPLETFVRQQNGFRNWNRGDIITELKQFGALCIQEEGTCQVKLTKDKGIPRVYRIRMAALEEHAERY